MDPGTGPLDARLRDPTGVGLRPGPPATPTQGPKPLSTTQLPSHPIQAQAQVHAQSQQGTPNAYQQHQQQQQHALPSYAHAQHQHQHPAHSHVHSHALAQTPSPPYTHASHGSHGSSSYTPQNTLTPIGTGAGNGSGQQQQQQQQQQYQQHQRGGSSGPVTPEGGTSGDPNDPKKQRACESCRGLKVRCEPDAANPEGPCKRCAKAGRACVVTQPTRKRQKKTDNRVAELEKKIDALTASLHATRTGGGGASGAPPHPMSSPEVGSASIPGAGTAGTGRGGAEGSSVSATSTSEGGGLGVGTATSLAVRDWASQVRETVRERSASSSTSTQRPSASQTLSSYGTIDVEFKEYSPPLAGHKRKHGEDDNKNIPAAPLQPPEEQPPDVVDRRIITMAQADELYRRYTDQMAPHLPAVVFPASMTAAELRETKPILFHAVMAAASSEWPLIQKALTKELMQVFADKVIVIGQKSLELVQALHVAVIWYWPPEHFEELKFYQLVHVSAIMAIDIGLGRRKQAKGGFRKHIPQNMGDHPLKKNAPPDPTTLEARRTWLACYFLATNTSMALHRPNLIRWTPFMAECVEVLKSSPEAAPSDSYLCHLIFTHKLAEEVGVLLSMDDPASMPSISDQRTQYALKGFERELEGYKNQLPPGALKPSLQMSFHVLNLYMHEIATHSDFSEDFKAMPPTADPFRETFSSGGPLTPAHIDGISSCLTAIDGIFDTFVSLDPLSIRCLPVYNFVRVAYAVVVLIKMYFAAASTKSELGKVINKDNMKVELHLEKLLGVFRATAADNKSRPATKFMLVLIMLRSWFHKQKQSQPGAAGSNSDNSKASSAPDNAPTPYQMDKNVAPPPRPPEYSTANTPLQLLSEVATNENAATPRTTNPDLLPPISSGAGQWFNNPATAPGAGRPPPPQQYMYDPEGAPVSAGTDSGPPPTTNLVSAGIGAMNPAASEHVSGFVAPWLNNAFAADFDYATLGDDFAQAMDWSLEELADGNLGSGMENGMRYFMSEPPWFQQMQNMGMGMGMVDGMGGQGGPVPGGQGGGGGMFPY